MIRTLAVLAFFIVIAIAQTYPLARNLTTHLPGAALGDNASFLWNFWWMRAALSSGDDYFHTTALMAPHGASLVLHTHTALTSFAGATLLGGTDLVASHNLVVIASLALNGLAAWALASHVSKNAAASLVAGVLFMLSPSLSARLMGHFNLLLAWTMVFGCLAMVRLVEKPTAWRSVLLGVAAAATAYADYYLVLFLALFVAVYCLVEVWTTGVTWNRRRPPAAAIGLLVLAGMCFAIAAAIAATGGGDIDVIGLRISARRPSNVLTLAWLFLIAAALVTLRPHVRITARTGVVARTLFGRLALATAVAFVLIAPLVEGAVRIWTAGDYATQTSALRSGPRGVDVATFFIGPPFHGLAGSNVRALYGSLGIDVMEESAWLGVLPIVLALAGRRTAPATALRRRWAALALVFFLWSLGPTLTVLGADSALLLPQGLARIVPVVNNARIPGRALVVVSLALAVLAAINIAARERLQRAPVVGAILLLAFAELSAAPLPLARLPAAGPIEAYLGGQSQDGAVLHVPFGLRDGFGARGALDHSTLYQQTTHGRAMAGGFVARIAPRVWEWHRRTEPFNALLKLSAGEVTDGLPSCAESLAGLRLGGVRYVVLDERGLSPAVTFILSLPLDTVLTSNSRRLLAVTGASVCDGQAPAPPSSAAQTTTDNR